MGLPSKGSPVYVSDLCPACQVERVITIMQNPRQYKIPDWFLNRQKDVKDGKYSQVCAEMGEIREEAGCLVRISRRRSVGKTLLTLSSKSRSWPMVWTTNFVKTWRD